MTSYDKKKLRGGNLQASPLRNYVRKTNRGKILQNIFQKACVGVEKESMSLRQSARIYGIDKIALLRYINKMKQAPHVKVGYSRHPSFTH